MFGILPQKQERALPRKEAVLPAAFDAASLHPLAGLGKQVEYLDLDTNTRQADGVIASRGFLEDLSYGTGTMYLLGLASGGAAGLVEGLRSTSPNMSTKLRTNAILNSITRRGPYLGNLFGCLTMTYNVVNGCIDAARGDYHNDAGSLAAGAITGALWNGTRGVRPMLISSGMMTGAAAAWCIFKRMVAPEDDE